MRMRMCPNIDSSTPIIVVVWGAMLIAFSCFLRKGNFTVNKVDAFNSRKHLCRGDVAFGKTDVTFTFHHSKTNQSPLVYTGQRLSVSLATPSTQFKH